MDVRGLGLIAKVIVAVLVQMADLERNRIKERYEAGRAAAKASLAETGMTHEEKKSLGRPDAGDKAAIVAWRRKTGNYCGGGGLEIFRRYRNLILLVLTTNHELIFPIDFCSI